MNRRLPTILVAVALVSACKDNPENDRRTASGQVLEGTISDEMLPLDTVQSQPPLMKAEPIKGADAKAEEAEEAAAPDAAATPDAPEEASAAQPAN
ncbi:MAG: hypothetical protein RIS17_689 [Pseudomonadota bacterium]|jgi:hypothetical protein